MARAFGDFCLKDFGLISVPDISHRRITEKDEFIVLATDGVGEPIKANYTSFVTDVIKWFIVFAFPTFIVLQKDIKVCFDFSFFRFGMFCQTKK